jgi:O-antigen/teichoic acid export membrane protein
VGIMLNRLKPKSEFSRNVLTLMTGTTIAQVIPIAISPILTRIYSPEDFGVFALYIGMASLFIIVATARYEIAIVLPDKDSEAINIFALSISITIILTILTFVVILFFNDNILNILKAKKLGNLIFLIPLSIFVAGIFQSLNYWANRKKYFKSISISQISQSITIGSLQVAIGYFNVGSGLIFGNIIGRVIAMIVLLKKFLQNDKKYLTDISKKMMIVQMKRYKDFPLINSIHAFSDTVRTSGSSMLISSFFGSSILGLYALAVRVLQVPISIIGSALGQVLYQKFTTIHNEKRKLMPYVIKTEIYLLVIAIPMFTILYYIAPSLFGFVFGEKWRVAGEYTQILTPYLFMNFLVSPISNLPIIMERQQDIFYISLFGNILFLSIFIIFHNLEIKTVFLFLSITQVIFYIYVMWWYFSIIRNNDE